MFLLFYARTVSEVRLGVLDDDRTRAPVTTNDTSDCQDMSRSLLYYNPVLRTYYNSEGPNLALWSTTAQVVWPAPLFSSSFLPDVQRPSPPKPSMRTTDTATLALARMIDSAHCLTWSNKAEVSHVPASILWHRANGRPSREEKAANQ